MLVSTEYREKLATYCLIRKCTQEQAVNMMIGEALERAEQDPTIKAKLDKARELRAALDAL
jgi:hypothetical protein